MFRLHTLSGAALQTHNNNNVLHFCWPVRNFFSLFFFRPFRLLHFHFDTDVSVEARKSCITISIDDRWCAMEQLLLLSLLFERICWFFFHSSKFVFLFDFHCLGWRLWFTRHTSISIHIICLFVCFSNSLWPSIFNWPSVSFCCCSRS